MLCVGFKNPNCVTNFISLHSKMTKVPRLIVFDLDYTLWPFYVCSLYGPFRKAVGNGIVDGMQQPINYYKDVPAILENLHSNGYKLGIASRSESPEGAKRLIQLFDWEKYFTYSEIYPGCKKKHFKRIKENSGIDYNEMLFFDDEDRNISDIRSLGVTCVLVSNGVDKTLLEDGLKQFDCR